MDGSKEQPKTTAGLDLGDKYSYLCLIDQHSGEIMEEGRLRTTPEAFRRRFASERPPIRIAIEAGTHSLWASSVLEECGHEVLVANARKSSAEAGDKANIAYCLEGLAQVAVAQGESEHAARLFGAAEESPAGARADKLTRREEEVAAKQCLLIEVRMQHPADSQLVRALSRRPSLSVRVCPRSQQVAALHRCATECTRGARLWRGQVQQPCSNAEGEPARASS